MAYTQFYRIKGGDGVLPTITFDRVDEIQFFFVNSALGQAWNRIHEILKCHQLFQKLLVMKEGGIHLHFLFCKIVCHD